MNDMPAVTKNKLHRWLTAPLPSWLGIGCALVVIFIFAGGPSLWDSLFHSRYVHTRSRNDLQTMYKLLLIYKETYHSYPSMQPTNTMLVKGGGVRDLYPLYTSGIMTNDALMLLRPPGCALLPFLVRPPIAEFDSNHIGYSYNSTVNPHDTNIVPLMAERGAADGILKKEEKPVFEEGVHVLMCNGQVTWIRASRDGVLQIEGITTTNELAKLLE